MKAGEDFSSHSNQISKLKKKSGNMVVLLRSQAFLLFCFLKYNFNFLFGQVFFFFFHLQNAQLTTIFLKLPRLLKQEAGVGQLW